MTTVYAPASINTFDVRSANQCSPAVKPITFIFADRQFQQKSKQKTAIIVSSSLIVKSAPSFSANDLFSLHSGSKILITDQIGQWIHIRLTNGNKGWILKEGCKEI